MYLFNEVGECTLYISFVGKKLCELYVVMQYSVAIALYVYSSRVTLCIFFNNCNGNDEVARLVVFNPSWRQSSVKPSISTESAQVSCECEVTHV